MNKLYIKNKYGYYNVYKIITTTKTGCYVMVKIWIREEFIFISLLNQKILDVSKNRDMK